jgi:citrate synthase
MGRLPDETSGKLLEAVLLAACDQGVIAPSITVARMAATCGVTFNCAMASGMNLLGKIHGGAIEDAMEVFYEVVDRSQKEGREISSIALDIAKKFKEAKKFLPGYGHPVHMEDPRTVRLWKMAADAKGKGSISGKYVEAAEAMFDAMKEISGKRLTINVDASGAAILCELGVPSRTAPGIICLSRGLGLLAHAFEESNSGKRMKAAMPADLLSAQMTYSGPPLRDLPAEKRELP